MQGLNAASHNSSPSLTGYYKNFECSNWSWFRLLLYIMWRKTMEFYDPIYGRRAHTAKKKQKQKG